MPFASHRSALALAALLTVAAGAGSARAAPDSSTLDEQVRQAIAGLDSDRFDVRELSTRALVQLGKHALGATMKAAAEGSAEAVWRAVAVINELALSDDPALTSGAEQALTALAEVDRPSAAIRARAALAELEITRHDRAVAMIAKLGGKIIANQLTLDANWTGGEEGLAYLKRIVELTQISIEPTAPLSEKAITRLKAEFEGEGKKVIQFGRAILGVTGSRGANENVGMHVVNVMPNGPAAKAGLLDDDIIVGLDDKRIRHFDDLVNYVRNKDVGDTVTITYYRAGEKRKGQAKLDARPGVVVPPEKK